MVTAQDSSKRPAQPASTAGVTEIIKAPDPLSVTHIASLPLDAKLTKEQRRAVVQAWYEADEAVREAERARCAAAKMIAERVSNKEFTVSWTGDKLLVRVGRKAPSDTEDRDKYVVVKVTEERVTV